MRYQGRLADTYIVTDYKFRILIHEKRTSLIAPDGIALDAVVHGKVPPDAHTFCTTGHHDVRDAGGSEAGKTDPIPI